MSKAVYEYSNQALPLKRRSPAFSGTLSRKNNDFLSACYNTGLRAIFDFFSLSSLCFAKRQNDDTRRGPTVLLFFLQVTDKTVGVMSVLTLLFG